MPNYSTLINKDLVHLLKKNGCISISDFFSEDEVSKIYDDFDSSLTRFPLNNNLPNAVYANTQKFMSQIFTCSKLLTDFVCSYEFQKLSSIILSGNHLMACRYYETGPNGVSMWHHDQKTHDDQSGEGLIFIVYLTDVLSVDQGPFQYIAGSQSFSNILNSYESYFAAEIESKYRNDIKSIYGHAGTLIIANSKIIHRACPHSGNYMRKSIFIQIDKLTDNKPYREKILIDPGLFDSEIFINNRDLGVFFGFGIKSADEIFPDTDINYLPVNKLFILQKQVALVMIKKILRIIFECLPVFVKKIIRRNILKSPVDYDSIK
jgi:hypothetical protein